MCVHSLSTAKKVPSTFTSASSVPPSWTTVAVPGGTSAPFATSTKRAITRPPMTLSVGSG